MPPLERRLSHLQTQTYARNGFFIVVVPDDMTTEEALREQGLRSDHDGPLLVMYGSLRVHWPRNSETAACPV